MNKKHLQNPPKKYRPAPFWSWNEKLNISETKTQVQLMENAGLGGFFMHARGGLQTEYLTKDWFDNVTAATDTANKYGMLAWGYDENGWPSGFGCGAVNGLGVEYQQKYLRIEKTEKEIISQNTITNLLIEGQNYHFFYEVNPFYVDTLNKNVIKEFLKVSHQKYLETLGCNFGGMTGFFTDEPQVSRSGYPWSLTLEKEYTALYGESLIQNLDALFFESKGYEKVRYQYWKLVRNLFCDAFNKQIFEWCKEHKQLFTGHMTCEESFVGQMQCNGSVMPNYEYMDIPGMDHLGRFLAETTTIMQLVSVANQLNKKQILSETFALCGWNVCFEDLRWIYESQLVRGVTYLCQHLQGYSLRGIRKRDYPASLYRHQPWWDKYHYFNDMVSRIGMLLSEGTAKYDVLVLHNIESGWLSYAESPYSYGVVNGFCDSLKNVMNELEKAAVQYHLGDGLILEKHARVENGKLKVGCQAYSVIIVPPATCFGKKTAELIKEFQKTGGTLIFTEKVPEYIDGVLTNEFKILAKSCPVIPIKDLQNAIPTDCKKILLDYKETPSPLLTTFRNLKKGLTMYYIVNPNNTSVDFSCSLKGKSATIFDAFLGKEIPCSYENNNQNIVLTHTLMAKDSVIFFVYDKKVKSPKALKQNSATPLNLKGDWSIKADDNTLTLDYCDLYINDQLKGEHIPICDVQEIACSYKQKIKVEVVFNFKVKDASFENMKLAIETPEIFSILVNSKEAVKKDLGFIHDPAFRLLDIKDLVQEGENEIRLICDFEQSPQVYQNMENSLVFESEKNKLTYDMEIEAIYLVGDFGVYSTKEFEKLEKRALRTYGDFYISRLPQTVKDGNLAEQGFPFFAGKVTLKKEIYLDNKERKNRAISFDRLPATVTNVKINKKDLGEIMWEPYLLNTGKLLKKGKNTIEITLIGNLRNLLGPFHLDTGESHWVCPPDFFKNSPIWCGGENKNWNDGYCFVEFGLFF